MITIYLNVITYAHLYPKLLLKLVDGFQVDVVLL